MAIATGEQAVATDVTTLVNVTHGEGAKHRWTDEKLLKGAGAGSNPTEVALPVGSLAFSGNVLISAATGYHCYMYPTGGKATIDLQAAEDFDSFYLCPKAGTIKNLYVKSSAAIEAGKDVVLTVRKNGAGQALTCTLTNGETTKNDTANSFTVAAGDSISIIVDHEDDNTDKNLIASVEYA